MFVMKGYNWVSQTKYGVHKIKIQNQKGSDSFWELQKFFKSFFFLMSGGLLFI